MDREVENVDEMIEIDLREYLKILIERKGTIIGVTLLAVLISGVISFFVLDPVYEAEATMGLSNRAGRYSEVTTAKQMLRSLSYFNQLNNELDLGLDQNQLRKLRNNLEIDEVNDRILELSFQSKDPKQAKLILGNLIDLFKADSSQYFERNQARLEGELEEVETEITMLEGRLSEREDNIEELLSTDRLSTADKVILSNEFGNKINDLEKLRYSLVDEKYKLKERVDDLEGLLVINAPITPESPVAPNKKLNLAIAAVLGLMLGLFMAFMAEFLSDWDRRDWKG
ncbi:YveK family protein [Natroniella sp. ANB-PHB2]|uniref:YveK family protein n=1 Tax=Natroniella sp. ANB-PHB2 TaxID=3384444 RepID=UPI0038D3FA5F